MDKNKCRICHKTDEDDNGGEMWIMCSNTNCVQWYHLLCVGLKSLPPKAAPWFCELCSHRNGQNNNSTEVCSNMNIRRSQSSIVHSLFDNQDANFEMMNDIDCATLREDKERELKMIADLIRDKEELFNLKMKQLNMVEQLSNDGRNSKVNDWINRHQNINQQQDEEMHFRKFGNDNNRQKKQCNVDVNKNIQQYGRGSAQKFNEVCNLQEQPEHRVMVNKRSQTQEEMVHLLQTQMKFMCRQYLEELPEFSGDPELWPIFFRQFIDTTEQGGFDDAHNLCRLRKCLKGEARDAVKGVLSLPNGLCDVIRILQTRFGRTDIIVRKKLKAIQEIVPPNENKPITVIKFYEALQDLNATLINGEADIYRSSPQTLDAIIAKLTPGMIRSWIKYRGRLNKPTLDDVNAWFQPFYECALIVNPESPREVPQFKKNFGRVNVHEESKFKKDSRKKSEFLECPNEQCRFCRKTGHTIIKCNLFEKQTNFKKWRFVRQNGLCFNCLLARHSNKECFVKVQCRMTGCDESYHSLLHRHKSSPEVTNNLPVTSEPVNTQNNKSVSTFFRMIPVKLFNNAKQKSVTTWAFLDEGSSPTMISEEIAVELELEGPQEELCTTWTDSSIRKEPLSRRVMIEVSGWNMTKQYKLSNVRTVTKLNLPMPNVNIALLKTKYSHLKDVNIPDVPFTRPGMLIGLEHAKLGIMYEVREGFWDEPIASRTRLGWAIHGKGSDSLDPEYNCFQCECNGDDTLHESIREFYTTEAFGVNMPDKKLESNEIIRARKLLEETKTKLNIQYETGLLWKHDEPKLPNNRSMALKRLICFEQKLNRDPQLQKSVLDKIKSHIQNGYLKKVTNEELYEMGDQKWYLPMFAVKNPNKPGKMRLVFDAAAKFNGVSLNDMLSSGPDQLASLFGVLLRFREGKVAVAADIAEMFHRIRVIEKDQNFQLILWRDVDPSKPPETYKLEVLTFGATCSPSSAQFVKNTNAKVYEKEYPRAVEAILRRHYVDDFLDSFDSEEEALEISNQIIFIHAQGGFNIRNWTSSSANVTSKLNPDFKGTIGVSISEESVIEKVLGLFWEMETDEFTFRVNFERIDPDIVHAKRIPSKREVLRIIMSLFDPLGFLSIITVCGKILMQDLWRCGIKWDEQIPNELITRWTNWLAALKNVENLRIPRCMSKHLMQSSNIQLHLFCDASEEAFAVSAYLRIMYHENDVNIMFVSSKTRVAPQKTLSIPRLELQGAVMAVRLKNTIISELSIKINEIFFWTDSLTVLGWIRSIRRKYAPFVSHRIGEILDCSSINQWRWVPTQHNVADDVTRSMEFPKVSARWFEGPEFLQDDQNTWPKERIVVCTTEEELKHNHVNQLHQNPYANIQANKFSKWERLLRSTAYVIRYLNKLKKRIVFTTSTKANLEHNMNIQLHVSDIPALDADELNRAEIILFKKVQFESYLQEFIDLKKSSIVEKKSSIYNLNPYLCGDGLIRLCGRLDSAPTIVSSEVKNPVLLERHHRITHLFVDKIHRQFLHTGRESLVNEVRQRVWIPKIRIAINSVITHCNFCVFKKAKPQNPRMAPLPVQRMTMFKPAFTNTGIDFFGPVEVTVARHHEKRWGVIFTCLTSRAIHLEVASSLNTNSTIMCIRNFANRRGMPEKFISDNGTNFKAAEKELRAAVNDIDFNQIVNETRELSCNQKFRTDWSFIPPSASHFGGVWERMVGTVKVALYNILKTKAPREETLRSALIEIENVVNSRPLTYTSSDIDSPEAITPNHLLRGLSNNPYPYEGLNDVRKQWRLSQLIADEFWKRWLKEYLPTISQRSKWYAESSPILLNQLVLILDTNLPRNEWKRGIITQLYPSADGRIRSAQVKTAKGVYDRPVSKLAIINLSTNKL